MAIRDVSRILQNTPHKSQIPVIKWSTNKMLGILIEKLRDFHLVKKCSAFYGTRNFITVFKSPALGPYPGQIDPIRILSLYLIKINFNIILPSTPRFPKWYYPFRFSD